MTVTVLDSNKNIVVEWNNIPIQDVQTVALLNRTKYLYDNYEIVIH